MSNTHTEVPSESEIIKDDNPSLSDELLIVFIVMKPQQPTERVTRTNFRVLRSLLLTSEESSMNLISQMLSSTSIPSNYQQRLIRVISQGVRAIPSNKHHMFAHFVIIEFGEQNRRWCVHFLKLKEMSLCVASSKAYEFLKSDEGPLGRVCVICLEDHMIQTDSARLPCSHDYHRSCIVEWLKKTNLCPICRFQLPTTYHNSISLMGQNILNK